VELHQGPAKRESVQTASQVSIKIVSGTQRLKTNNSIIAVFKNANGCNQKHHFLQQFLQHPNFHAAGFLSQQK